MFVTGMKVDRVTDTAEWTLGTVGAIFDGGLKMYKYMQYEEGTAAVQGEADEVAYYVADTGYEANQVTSDLSDSSEVCAGKLPAVMTDGQYGWFQIKGVATLALALTAGADGDPLTPTGSSDGTLDVAALATDVICGHAIDASAKVVYLDCPW